MKKLIILLSFLAFNSIYASGIDDMILWRYNLPAPDKNTFSLDPFTTSGHGLNAAFLYSNPYRISSLYWNYAALKFGTSKYGIYASGRFYGLKDLYSADQITLGTSFRLHSNLALAFALKHEIENFSGLKNYFRTDFDIKLSARYGKLFGGLELDKINLEKPYDFQDVAMPEPLVYGAYAIDTSLQLASSLKRLDNGKFRWYFNQHVKLVDGIGLALGYYNNPNVFNWGIDLNWRKFTFDFYYFAISRLNDTMFLGLSIAM